MIFQLLPLSNRRVEVNYWRRTVRMGVSFSRSVLHGELFWHTKEVTMGEGIGLDLTSKWNLESKIFNILWNGKYVYLCHSSCRWHRLGISVKGNSATAILDCNEQDTQEIKRNQIELKTDGVILFGQEIDDKDYFSVRIFFNIFDKTFITNFSLGRHPAFIYCSQSWGSLQSLHRHSSRLFRAISTWSHWTTRWL